MLAGLRISNLAVVNQVEIEFEPGFTVLTGETGAGKSILIDALLLALGERANTDVIRHGSEQAQVSATFEVANVPSVLDWLRDHSIECDEQGCVLRRSIRRDGKSRCYVNGVSVSAQNLRELGERLIDLQGQHEQHSLLRPDAQRRVLDRFANIESAVDDLGDRYRHWRSVRERLANLRQSLAERTHRIELIAYQLDELTTLDLKPGEWGALDAELSRASHASELGRICQQLLQLLAVDEPTSAPEQLAVADRLLAGAIKLDGNLTECRDLLESARLQLAELSASLERYGDELEVDPRRTAWLEERVGRALALARKHAVAPEELPAVHATLTAQKDDLANSEQEIARLAKALDEARLNYDQAAEIVSRARRHAAPLFSQATTELVQTIAMPNAEIHIQVEDNRSGEPSPTGAEGIALLAVTNRGEPPRPLARIASGGELSRIALAVQVVGNRDEGIATLIFDEVDVGIGGGAAQTVAELLRRLGSNKQVLCITHQPQVAALGHHHLRVQKDEGQHHASVTVDLLTPEQRVEEVARMLGGRVVTRTTREHAQELLTR